MSTSDKKDFRVDEAHEAVGVSGKKRIVLEIDRQTFETLRAIAYEGETTLTAAAAAVLDRLANMAHIHRTAVERYQRGEGSISDLSLEWNVASDLGRFLPPAGLRGEECRDEWRRRTGSNGPGKAA